MEGGTWVEWWTVRVRRLALQAAIMSLHTVSIWFSGLAKKLSAAKPLAWSSGRPRRARHHCSISGPVVQRWLPWPLPADSKSKKLARGTPGSQQKRPVRQILFNVTNLRATGPNMIRSICRSLRAPDYVRSCRRPSHGMTIFVRSLNVSSSAKSRCQRGETGEPTTSALARHAGLIVSRSSNRDFDLLCVDSRSCADHDPGKKWAGIGLQIGGALLDGQSLREGRRGAHSFAHACGFPGPPKRLSGQRRTQITPRSF